MFDDFKNAFQRPNHAHVQMIIINVVVFAVVGIITVFATLGEFGWVADIIENQFSIPAQFSKFMSRPWTLITYSFSHAGFMHILFNMLALYWFGQLFKEYLGSDKLIALYLLGAMVGGMFYLMAFNLIPYYVKTYEHVNLELLGASAAVDAIVVAAATLLPDYTFFLLFIGPVRIKYIAMVTVLLSFLGTIESNAGGNIAHLGGALMGFVYIKQLQAGVNWGGWITATLDWIKSLFSSKPKVKVTYRKTEPVKKSSGISKASQEEIDLILDKISDRGYESLTKEEKEKLFNASKK